ncbi:MAG: IS1595 family transposase [Gemmatimonadales bacterium]
MPRQRKPRKKPGPVGEAKSQVIRDLPVACSNELAATEFLEAQRWGDSPACPKCGDTDVRKMMNREGTERSKLLRWRCMGCRVQYTVRTGTVMEDSPIPLRHWCLAFWKLCASKKEISALQIQRETGLSYKSALFLMHRIRFGLAPYGTKPKLTGVVEADETYVGGKTPNRSRAERLAAYAQGHRRMPFRSNQKVPVVALVERGGDVRAMVVPVVTAQNVRDILLNNVDPSARLMTDESNLYTRVGKPFASHETVMHSLYEFARGEAHINSAESFFSRLKRQLYGTHHAVSKKHLHRYVAEVAFKHNTRDFEDGARVTRAIRGADGKRLPYRQPVRRAQGLV